MDRNTEKYYVALALRVLGSAFAFSLVIAVFVYEHNNRGWGADLLSSFINMLL